jgi:tRNA-dihydrouridine synthase B
MEKIVTTVVQTVRLPVTVKTRLGWDSESIHIVEVAKMLEQTGISALTIHCRTRAQAHKGEPDFSWIPKMKAAVSIPIIINGSLDTPEKIEQAFRETGCDGVMIGRGAIDNPWIFQHAKQYRSNPFSVQEPTIEERFRLLIEHFQLSLKVKGERRGIFEFRKHYTGYLKGFPNASRIRQELMKYAEPQQIIDTLHTYELSLLDRHKEVVTQQVAI